MTAAVTIQVDIWSDVVCPWCYIGKRRFERAVADLAGEIDIEVTYKPYQLDPTASPGKSMPVLEAYTKKFGGPEQAQMLIDRVTSAGAEDGLDFRLDRAMRANTLLAHRMLWLAAQPDAPCSQEALKERLLQAYFVDGLDIGDPETLASCAADVGFDRDEMIIFLESGDGRAEVADLIGQAVDLGISAVPTFVINDQWSIPGAQDSETFVNVLRRVVANNAADDVAAH